MILPKEWSHKGTFSQRFVNPCNLLHTDVFDTWGSTTLKYRIDRNWKNQDVMYDYKVKLKYISLSNISNVQEVDSDLA